jgi:hypothetical protein
MLRHELVKQGGGEPPTPEEFKKLEAASVYIKQRLPDRLYYAAILTVMEALPVGLGKEVPVAVIDQWEKLTAVLGRKNEWLPKKGRRQGAKRKRPADAQEETRRNQVLDAIGELDPIRKKDVRISVIPRSIYGSPRDRRRPTPARARGFASSRSTASGASKARMSLAASRSSATGTT